MLDPVLDPLHPENMTLGGADRLLQSRVTQKTFHGILKCHLCETTGFSSYFTTFSCFYMLSWLHTLRCLPLPLTALSFSIFLDFGKGLILVEFC